MTEQQKEYKRYFRDLAKRKLYFGYAHHLGCNDERLKEAYDQHKKLGFDDTEWWNLDVTIAKFVLPRLKRMKEKGISMPPDLNEVKWSEVLDKMIFSMDYYAEGEVYEKMEELTSEAIKYKNLKSKASLKAQEKIKELKNQIDEGMTLFGKYFGHLWD